MKRKRRSSVATPSDRPRTFAEIRQTSAPREARWNRLYTQSVIRASQPDPYRRLIPAALQSFRPEAASFPPLKRTHPVRSRPTYYLVDRRTGEIAEASDSVHSLTARRCREAKDDRRHYVIKNGYGGHNGFKDYKKHSEC